MAAEIGGAAYELDVRSTDSIRAAVEGAESDLAPLDVLVNNAGYDEFGWFVNTEPDMWDRVLAVNLRGVIAVTHAVLPGMQERRGADRERRVRGRPPGLARLGRVLGRQGGRDRPDQGGGAGRRRATA